MSDREPQAPDVEAASQSVEAAPATEALTLEEQVQKLGEEKKALEEEKKSLFDRLLRRQADFENFRKRLEREQQETRRVSLARLVGELLPVLDAFERALAHEPGEAEEDYHKGIELIYKQLFDVLAGVGLQPLEVVGRPFDPLYHHAVERVETTEHPDEQVITELQRGYTFQQQLLRPALVRVAVHPGSPTEQKPEE